MFFGEIVGFTQVIREIIEFDLFSGHDQLPLSFADRDRLAWFPIEALMSGWSFFWIDDGQETLAIDFVTSGGNFAKFQKSGIPIATACDLVAGFVLREFPWPRNDGGNTDASFVETELGTAMRAGAPASIVGAYFEALVSRSWNLRWADTIATTSYPKEKD
jgi:hypothetical protein